MMVQRHLSAVVVATMVLAGCTLLLFGDQYELTPPRPADTPIEVDYGMDLDRSIALFEARVTERDEDYLSRLMLGRMYVEQAKRLADGSYFDKAGEQFQSALDIVPQHPEALLGLATVAMANHEFEKALTLAEEAWSADDEQLLALAMIGDAQLEMGNYDAAADTYETLADQLLVAPVQVRLARLAELQGRPEEAVERIEDALRQMQEVNSTRRDRAWYAQVLGEVLLAQGRHEAARKQFELARSLDPSSRPTLLFLGHTVARQGDWTRAEDWYWQAMELNPQPEIYAALGDLRAIRGQSSDARAYYRRALTLWDHGTASHHHHHDLAPLPGEPVDLARRAMSHSHSHSNPDAHARTISLFLSDRNLDPARALRLARTNLESRQDVHSWDALAWALYRNGEFAAAQDAIEQALAQGTREAALWYHAGLIHSAMGQNQEARQCFEEVAAIDARFSVLHQTDAADRLHALAR